MKIPICMKYCCCLDNVTYWLGSCSYCKYLDCYCQHESNWLTFSVFALYFSLFLAVSGDKVASEVFYIFSMACITEGICWDHIIAAQIMRSRVKHSDVEYFISVHSFLVHNNCHGCVCCLIISNAICPQEIQIKYMMFCCSLCFAAVRSFILLLEFGNLEIQ